MAFFLGVAAGALSPAPADAWFGRDSAAPQAWDLPPSVLRNMEAMGIQPGPIERAADRERDRDERARFEARRHYMHGVWLMARGDYAQAREAFEIARDNEPDLLLIRLAIARSLLKQGKLDECIERCREVLVKDPHFTEARILKAETLVEQGKLDEAIDAYRQGLQEKPESLALLDPLGTLYLKKGDVEGALDIFERVHRRLRLEQRRSLYVMMVLSQLYDLSGKTDQAIDMYREALRVYPDHGKIYQELILLFLRRKQTDEALEMARQGLIRLPFDTALQRLFEKAAGSREDALAQYRRFAEAYDQLSEIQVLWGLRARELGDLKASEEAFGRALAFDEEHPVALLGLAEAMLARGETAEARRFFERAVASHPDDPAGYRGLADAAMQQNEWDKAIEAYDAALELAPSDLDTALKLASALERQGRLDEAVERLETARERFAGKSEQAKIHERLGDALMRAGKPVEAAEAFRLARESAPGSLWLHRRLMVALLAAGREAEVESLIEEGRRIFEKRRFEFELLVAETLSDSDMRSHAIKALRSAIDINPNIFDLHQRLVLQLYSGGQKSEAEAALDQARGLFGGKEKWRMAVLQATLLLDQQQPERAVELLDPQVRQALTEGATGDRALLSATRLYAVALDKVGRRPDAFAVCRDALGVWGDQGGPDTLHVMGQMFMDVKAWDEARVIYERLTAMAPDNDEYHYQLGAVWDQLDNETAAERLLRKAIDLNPGNYNALNHLGYMYTEGGRRLDEALDLIRRALELNPDAGYIIDSLGWTYYRLGRYEKAVEHLERAASKEHVDPVILDHLGDAHRKAGNLERAVECWQRSLELDDAQTTVSEKLRRVRETLRLQSAPDATPQPHANPGGGTGFGPAPME